MNFSGLASKIDMQILLEDLRFPEGPAFASDGSLWAVELKGECLVRYSKESVTRYHVGGMPNGIAIADDGMIWFCDAGLNAIRFFNLVTQQATTVATHVEEEGFSNPNDLAFDQKGNLVFTCPGDSRQAPTGYACVLMKDGGVKKITNAKYFPNGVAFSNDGKSLVIAETYKHRLWKGDWNAETGEWTNETVWCNVGGPSGPGGPDGMAFDREGNLYVAVYGVGSIKVVNNAGIIIDEIKVLGNNPTNCAFDPGGKFGLAVTEAEKGLLINVTIEKKYSHGVT